VSFSCAAVALSCCSDGNQLIACKTSAGNCPSGYIPASLSSNTADEQCWLAAANFTSCSKISNRTLSLYSKDATGGAVLTRCIYLPPGTTNCSAVTGFTTSLTKASSLQGCYAPSPAGGATGQCPTSAEPEIWSFALYDRTDAATSAAVLTECRAGITASVGAGCASVPGIPAGYDAEVSQNGGSTQQLMGCVRAASCPTQYAKFLLSANATLESCQATLTTCTGGYSVSVCSGDTASADSTTGACTTPVGCLAATAQRCITASTNNAVANYPGFIVSTPLTSVLKACFATSLACPVGPNPFTFAARQGTLNTDSIAGCTDTSQSACQTFWRAITTQPTWVCT
jgi:hypothetical protein